MKRFSHEGGPDAGPPFFLLTAPMRPFGLCAQ